MGVRGASIGKNSAKDRITATPPGELFAAFSLKAVIPQQKVEEVLNNSVALEANKQKYSVSTAA
jgi:hypothetical protein